MRPLYIQEAGAHASSATGTIRNKLSRGSARQCRHRASTAFQEDGVETWLRAQDAILSPVIEPQRTVPSPLAGHVDV
jgi:hypothetical protein